MTKYSRKCYFITADRVGLFMYRVLKRVVYVEWCIWIEQQHISFGSLILICVIASYIEPKYSNLTTIAQNVRSPTLYITSSVQDIQRTNTYHKAYQVVALIYHTTISRIS